MCWVNHHQCRSRQMWKILTNSPRALTFVYYKMVSFQHIRMSSYAKTASHDWTIYSFVCYKKCNDWTIFQLRTNNITKCRCPLMTQHKFVESILMSLNLQTCVESLTTKSVVYSPWICEYFPHLATSTLMLSDLTHLLFVLSIRGHTYELKAYHE